MSFNWKASGLFAAGVAFVQLVSRFYQARMLSVLIHSVQQQRFVLRIVL